MSFNSKENRSKIFRDKLLAQDFSAALLVVSLVARLAQTIEISSAILQHRARLTRVGDSLEVRLLKEEVSSEASLLQAL